MATPMSLAVKNDYLGVSQVGRGSGDMGLRLHNEDLFQMRLHTSILQSGESPGQPHPPS